MRAKIRFRSADGRKPQRRRKPRGSDSHGLRSALRIRLNVRRVHTRYSRFQEFRVSREILLNDQGSAEIHHGHQAVRPGALCDELRRRAARLDLVGHLHRGIVEEQDHVMLLPLDLHRRVRAKRKARNGLFSIVLENLEILLRQVRDVLPFLVHHHRVHQDDARLRADDCASGHGRLISCRGGCRRFGGIWRLRTSAKGPGGQRQQRHRKKSFAVHDSRFEAHLPLLQSTSLISRVRGVTKIDEMQG